LIGPGVVDEIWVGETDQSAVGSFLVKKLEQNREAAIVCKFKLRDARALPDQKQKKAITFFLPK